MDYATAPFIDLATLGLPNHPLSSRPPMAERVSWHPEVHKSEIAPPPPAWRDSIALKSKTTDAPAIDGRGPAADISLALAERVDGLQEPFFFRNLAELEVPEPAPSWAIAKHDDPRLDLIPDHDLISGIQADILNLLKALWLDPGCALLESGSEGSLLPATQAPLALARPQDLAYTLTWAPEPESLAAAVAWHPDVHAADAAAVAAELHAACVSWPERQMRTPEIGQHSRETLIPLAPRATRLLRLLSAPCRRSPEARRTEPVATVPPPAAGVAVPVMLRGFHEDGLLVRPFVQRATRKSSTPGWMLSLVVALFIILTSTWFLQKSTFADRFLTTHAESGNPSDAALGAFPSMAKYVEVTGLRASVDTKKGAEVRYIVVNHSPADLPPFQVNVRIHPRKGSATVFSFSETVPGLGPNESREMHTTIPGELHSYEMPDWTNLRIEAHVTPRS